MWIRPEHMNRVDCEHGSGGGWRSVCRSMTGDCCRRLLSPLPLSDERRETHDGAGRDAAADANEKHHGVREHEEGVLHLHPQHHSGGRRPHAGKHRPTSRYTLPRLFRRRGVGEATVPGTVPSQG